MKNITVAVDEETHGDRELARGGHRATRPDLWSMRFLDTNVLLYAAILAAARVAGCDAVYSEDMSAAQDYDGPRVLNPFAEDVA